MNDREQVEMRMVHNANVHYLFWCRVVARLVASGNLDEDLDRARAEARAAREQRDRLLDILG